MPTLQSGGLHKLSRDVVWTGASFAILALSGLIINAAILSLRDASALGIFNQTYAVYIVASQLAVGGLHYATLRAAATADIASDLTGVMLGSALALGLVLGLTTGIVLYLAAPSIGQLLDSPEVGRSTMLLAPAMPLFSASKIILGYLNGQRHMKAYAVIQAMRYLALTLVVVACGASSASVEWFAAAFPVAEFITAFSALAYVKRSRLVQTLECSRGWLEEHLAYASRAWTSGLLIETNSRLDVLAAGFFLSDRAVGIYSFASMLAEGLTQLLSVTKVNFNPLLVAAIKSGDWNQALHLRAIGARYVFPAAVLLALLAGAAFFFVGHWLLPARGLNEGTAALAILLVTLCALSPLLPFDNLLLLNGYPAQQSMQYATIAVVTLIASAILCPAFGIAGVAASAALGYGAGVTFLIVLVRKHLGWDLLLNLRLEV